MTVKSRIAVPIALFIATFLGGCSRPPVESFASSDKVLKLGKKSQTEIRGILAARSGTPDDIRLLGQPNANKARLKNGAAVYAKNCRQCHGTTGDGNGPAAVYLLPKPRDYRRGNFKFTSTLYGSQPLREDLIRTVRRGIAGTSMPSFRLMSQTDMDDVIDYVLALTHRGELEFLMADSVELEEPLEKTAVDQMVTSILTRWDASKGQVVHPSVPMPVLTAENVVEGKAAFLSKGCAQCHGEDGRGQMPTNIGVDSWGNPTKAADLTSGMLRGGTEPIDVYRHISAGINGTPMPSFSTLFQQEPETMWKIAAFVMDLSNRRRKGEIPEAGLLKPLPGVDATGKAPASATPTTPAAGGHTE